MCLSGGQCVARSRRGGVGPRWHAQAPRGGQHGDTAGVLVSTPACRAFRHTRVHVRSPLFTCPCTRALRDLRIRLVSVEGRPNWCGCSSGCCGHKQLACGLLRKTVPAGRQLAVKLAQAAEAHCGLTPQTLAVSVRCTAAKRRSHRRWAGAPLEPDAAAKGGTAFRPIHAWLVA